MHVLYRDGALEGADQQHDSEAERQTKVNEAQHVPGRVETHIRHQLGNLQSTRSTDYILITGLFVQ